MTRTNDDPTLDFRSRRDAEWSVPTTVTASPARPPRIGAKEAEVTWARRIAIPVHEALSPEARTAIAAADIVFAIGATDDLVVVLKGAPLFAALDAGIDLRSGPPSIAVVAVEGERAVAIPLLRRLFAATEPPQESSLGAVSRCLARGRIPNDDGRN